MLDVGTGTGILARALVAAGAEVVGSDVDDGMAAVARRSGMTVHVGSFESLDLDATFDRISVAQAWHWIEPGAGLAAVRRLLAPGGQLWLLWNVGDLEPHVKTAVDAVYARFAADRGSQVDGGGISRGVSERAADRAERFFGDLPGASVHTLEVPWRAEHTTASWVRLVATFSDHVTQPDDVRVPLLAALAEAVDAAGGRVTIEYTTRVVAVAGLAG